MPKNNPYLIKENYKKVEEVREIENETPSFEEFMKTYEVDEKVVDSYKDEVEYVNVWTPKGCGPNPIGEYWVQYTHSSGQQATACGEREKVVRYFSLKVECRNWDGLGEDKTADSTREALTIANWLENGHWNNSSWISSEVMNKCAALVREAVRYYHRGNDVSGYVKVRGRFWGSPEWSYRY